MGINVIIYEPVIEEDECFHSKVTTDLNEFKKLFDLMAANRWQMTSKI
jgi:UDPglucose 6-dehydrogenase